MQDPGVAVSEGCIVSAVIEFETDKPIEIELSAIGLTCLCPVNGRVDNFDVLIRYVPACRLIELGWLRAHLEGFADVPVLHERFTAELLETLTNLVGPSYIHVTTTWAPVEGVGCTVRMVGGE